MTGRELNSIDVKAEKGRTSVGKATTYKNRIVKNPRDNFFWFTNI